MCIRTAMCCPVYLRCNDQAIIQSSLVHMCRSQTYACNDITTHDQINAYIGSRQDLTSATTVHYDGLQEFNLCYLRDADPCTSTIATTCFNTLARQLMLSGTPHNGPLTSSCCRIVASSNNPSSCRGARWKSGSEGGVIGDMTSAEPWYWLIRLRRTSRS
jgi:hypothetical protein